MPITEKRRLGAIVQYKPKEQSGTINDVETHKDYEFFCQHVRSDALRIKLAQTDRFDEKFFIQPNIYVTYALCSTITGEMAGRIELVSELPPETDLGAPLIGYIQHFGKSNTGADGFAGWINPQLGVDEQGSVWFDLDKVIDPALKEYLRANSQLKKHEWRSREIRVRYWKIDERRRTPSAVHVALVDEAVREKWLRVYSVDENSISRWNELCEEHLYAPDALNAPRYVEMPIQRPPLTLQEIKMMDAFRKESYNVTASNPAHRGQLNALWQIAESGQEAELSEALAKLPNINGTKLAILCRAACRYYSKDYADALELCRNAQRYDFAAELAMSIGQYGIAQRMAETALNEEPTERRLRLLGKAAVHTGNAQVFCDAFEEMIEACEGFDETEDECDLFAEIAITLLDGIGINSDDMEMEQICQTVRENYMRPLPSLNDLIAEQRRADNDPASNQSFSIPENGFKEPVYYSAKPVKAKKQPDKETGKSKNVAAMSMDAFKQRFMIDKSYRLPDRAKDLDTIPMIDGMLAAELPSVGDYRMPLLVRLCLDPEGSEQHILKYITRLERVLDGKRGKYDRDRRWRLFKALLEYVQATDSTARAEAWTRARTEAQGTDEPRLLDSLPR